MTVYDYFFRSLMKPVKTFPSEPGCPGCPVTKLLKIPCGTKFFAGSNFCDFCGFFSRSTKISSHKIKLP